MTGEMVMDLLQNAPPELLKAVFACSAGFHMDVQIATSAILLVVGDPDFEVEKAIETLEQMSFTCWDGDDGSWCIVPGETRRYLAKKLHEIVTAEQWQNLQRMFADYCRQKSEELCPEQAWEQIDAGWNSVKARHLKWEECYHLLMMSERQEEAVEILRTMLDVSPDPSEAARVICLYIEDAQEHTDVLHPSMIELHCRARLVCSQG